MTDPAIVFDHVVKEYQSDGSNRKPVRAVDDVSLSIEQGEIFGIIGYSGAGKSTLVRMINALERPTSGTVTVLGEDLNGLKGAQLRAMRQKIGMIFQQFNLFANRTVAQNIAYPLELDHWRKDYQERRVQQLLRFVGLSDYADRYPAKLSGGQKQRVGIARALATNPKILLADEATSALDPQTTAEVLDLLRQANEQLGITVVTITHQMSVVKQIASRVAVMSQGRVVETGSAYNVFALPDQAVTKRFTATAVSGLPEPARLETMRAQWPGRIVTIKIRQRDVMDGDELLSPASGQDISDLIAKFGVSTSMLYGGIDTVDGSAIGAMTYELSGDEMTVNRFLEALSRGSDVYDFGTAANPVQYQQAVARVLNPASLTVPPVSTDSDVRSALSETAISEDEQGGVR